MQDPTHGEFIRKCTQTVRQEPKMQQEEMEMGWPWELFQIKVKDDDVDKSWGGYKIYLTMQIIILCS